MVNQVSMIQLDKSGSRVRKMFEEIAPRYDLMNHVLSLGIDISWRKRTVRELRLDGVEPILDCCTGTGDLALMLSRRVGSGVRVIGTDFCLPMLTRAEKKKTTAGEGDASEVEFLEADTQSLPFQDGTFQAVTVAFGLRNVEDTDQGLREMTRVCRPGGQVAVLEFSKPTAPGLRQVYSAYFKYVLPRIGQSIARNGQGAYEYLPSSVTEFPCGQALAQRMRDVGLKDIRIIPLTFGIATLYVGER
ncbi:MAG: bifunctional demethylmenaquinone methyltransferase/2-methoxy-6-polyprenyl-1,4-benzoquinol methylase UbiE [Pirellulaceae bacterium]|nr:bifunctional demethylmenaquinone methyltransferase/2-methoxy-6-polyprenyl-1,4-benzoquinol methylase UbiE [Pirellulaceae bacterium]